MRAAPATIDDHEVQAALTAAGSRVRPPVHAGVEIDDVMAWVGHELDEVESFLAAVRGGGDALERCAHHLLGLGGKRLRPTCLLLASRLAPTRPAADDARTLAVAVELVHVASLLHDDVIDDGGERRGAPTARIVHGNAVSVLAGDWLLVEALRRVQRALGGGLLPGLLEVLRAMSAAESLQLAHRGQAPPERGAYFRIVEGKTAGLFGWALRAGAVAGGASGRMADVLAEHGRLLGIAFQIVDDVLDFEAGASGKDAFQDAGGQASLPLALARARDPGLLALLAARPATDDEGWRRSVMQVLVATGALRDARIEAEAIAGRARAALRVLPAGEARESLEAVADGIAKRNR